MTEGLLIKRIRVYGIVQGVGFRPNVDRLAHEVGITGTVANKGAFVEIFVEGTTDEIREFLRLLRTKAPERSDILKIEVEEQAISEKEICNDRKYTDFNIIESEKVKAEIFISPDIAICDKCKKELFDKKNRRYLHPFINCNQCGPRFSILKALPYDRERTSMSVFPMCTECKDEYFSPKSRRYDAQPVCCNHCGPEVYILYDALCLKKEDRVSGSFAITLTRKVLCEGGIVAVKGIGGFHLACDATNDKAVRRLRELKHRPMKPFAVMAKDESVANRECIISSSKRREMNGHRKPIILMEKREGGKIVEAVAPENPYIGLMLPYAPVQMLLFDYPDEWQEKMPDVLVMTSGNVSGAPIASNDKEALEELSDLCDLILSNDRDIQIRTDDSVMDYYEDEPYMIRRSRGIAPLPIILNSSYQHSNAGTEKKINESFSGNVLGIGGELKNTFCLGIKNIFYPSAYVGDLGDTRTVKVLRSSIERTEKLLEMEPKIIASDLHPKYNSTLFAEELSKEKGIPLIRVQHHYAHVLSCMAENDYLDEVIGISFDGTGLGTDDTIWGGEILLSDVRDFERKASIAPFLQVGGDISSKEGWRIAVSMINALFALDGIDISNRLGLADEKNLKVQRTLFDKKINAVTSTSAGRLFDAVSAILGIRKNSTFEGEASTALMYKAFDCKEKASSFIKNSTYELIDIDVSGFKRDLAPEKEKNSAKYNERERDYLRTDLLVKKIVEERLDGRDIYELAYFFHYALSQMIIKETSRVSMESGIRTAALTGGVFQNKLLLALVENGLKERDIKVLRHHMIPPNDGGIALGQALRAAVYLRDNF